MLQRPSPLSKFWVAGALAAVFAGCKADQLQGVPATPLAVGGVRGHICDRSTGGWVSNAEIYVESSPSLRSTTDDTGAFLIEGVKPGEYTLLVEGETYAGRRQVTVGANEITDIGVDTCIAETGSIRGRICDDVNQEWLVGATATVTLPGPTVVSAISDEYGRYFLENIPVGAREVVVTYGDFTETLSVLVPSASIANVGDHVCGPVGGLKGRICGTEGLWLANAQISITAPDGEIYTTLTDGSGFFTLVQVPVGSYSVTVRRGAFETTFEATIVGGTTQEMPSPICIAPTTDIAVVTGSYDTVEDVLTDLGFDIRAYYDDAGAPDIVDGDGTVDIYDGYGDWATRLLGDPVGLARYDVIFFNCGLSTWDLDSLPLIQNLRDYVSNGGSVYASDWAGEVVNIVFPDRVNFVGPTSSFWDAQIGEENSSQTGIVTDEALENHLDRATITLNLDLGMWVVLETFTLQPDDLRTWVIGNVMTYDGAIANSPLMVQFGFGEGRVLFTAFHNEAQATQDMEDVLNFIVFEL
jgi:hypothetical protein